MAPALLLLIFIAAPTFAGVGQLMFSLPAGAEKAGHVVLQPSIAEQDFFWLQVPYPSVVALDHYSKVFANWRQCTSPDTGWISYGDSAQGANRFIHIRSHFWVSAKDDEAVTLILRYESKGSSFRKVPDNDRQFVAVIHHRIPDAGASVADLGVLCPRGLTGRSTGRRPALRLRRAFNWRRLP